MGSSGSKTSSTTVEIHWACALPDLSSATALPPPASVRPVPNDLGTGSRSVHTL